MLVQFLLGLREVTVCVFVASGLSLTAQMAELVRVSFGAVDSGLIPSVVLPMTLKLQFTASLLDAQH